MTLIISILIGCCDDKRNATSILSVKYKGLMLVQSIFYQLSELSLKHFVLFQVPGN